MPARARDCALASAKIVLPDPATPRIAALGWLARMSRIRC